MRIAIWTLILSTAAGAIYLLGVADGLLGLPSTKAAPDTQALSANLKVAFIADQGIDDRNFYGMGARDVLQLIKDEGTDIVLHQGDFDYRADPDLWDQQINDVLGPDFPYFASIGNHDVDAWPGYQQKLQARLDRVTGASCTGDLGVKSACRYRGLFFILYRIPPSSTDG